MVNNGGADSGGMRSFKPDGLLDYSYQKRTLSKVDSLGYAHVRSLIDIAFEENQT